MLPTLLAEFSLQSLSSPHFGNQDWTVEVLPKYLSNALRERFGSTVQMI